MESIKLFLQKIKRRILKPKFDKSYSQGGEDMILNTIFAGVKTGYYVDVGACDPYFQSNTQFFYNKGWAGINIDANEDGIKKFNNKRPRDKNIIALVHKEEKEFEFFYYENPAYNGCFSQENIPSKLKYSKKIKSVTLNSILTPGRNNKINFLSVDAEGNELNILSSLNLQLIRPQVILVESFQTNISRDLDTEITKYLKNNRYKYLCKTLTNSFYISLEFAKERFNNDETY